MNSYKFVEEYYDGMPDSDIVNSNAQFLLGIEEAVRTTSIFKGISCSILGVYASNAFGLERALIPSYKELECKKRGGIGGFIRDILIEDGLFGDADSCRHDRSTLNQTAIKISVYLTVTYPFSTLLCHLTVCRISVRRNNVSCNWQRSGIKQRLSIVD